MPRRRQQRLAAKAVSIKSKPNTVRFDSYEAPIALFAGLRPGGLLHLDWRAFVLGGRISFPERAQFAASVRSPRESTTFSTIVKLRIMPPAAWVYAPRSTAFARRWVRGEAKLPLMRRRFFGRKPAARNRQLPCPVRSPSSLLPASASLIKLIG